jgi:hypothetical protein
MHVRRNHHWVRALLGATIGALQLSVQRCCQRSIRWKQKRCNTPASAHAASSVSRRRGGPLTAEKSAPAGNKHATTRRQPRATRRTPCMHHASPAARPTERRWPGLHQLNRYSQGTHSALAGYSQGTHRVLTGYSQGTRLDLHQLSRREQLRHVLLALLVLLRRGVRNPRNRDPPTLASPRDTLLHRSVTKPTPAVAFPTAAAAAAARPRGVEPATPTSAAHEDVRPRRRRRHRRTSADAGGARSKQKGATRAIRSWPLWRDGEHVPPGRRAPAAARASTRAARGPRGSRACTRARARLRRRECDERVSGSAPVSAVEYPVSTL